MNYPQPPQQPEIPADWGALDISLSYMPLQWVLEFVSPIVEIDGYKLPKNWSRHVIPLAPGQHSLRVYFPYLFQSECGLITAPQGVSIYSRTATGVKYEAPWFMFSAGTLVPVGTRPL
jgi:hypothetical protein